MRRFVLAAASAAIVAHDAAAQVVVSPSDVSFSFEAGEAQSTVVPPGLKSQCAAGRILVTNDWVRPTSTPGATVAGVARWRDLDGASSAESVFDAPPDAADYVYGSNDHNIVTLPNGDVVYQIAGMSKRPIGAFVGSGGGTFGKALGKLGALLAKPAWFDATFRGAFGPGARGSLMTWRSEDCGETFRFVSEIDSAGIGHEDCALPQPLGGPPSVPAQKWDMGGTDGPWLGVVGDRLVATMGCVGNRSKPGVAGYELDPASPVARNYVMESADRGTTWRVLGRYDAGWVWRLPAAPLSDGYAFGLWNAVVTASGGAKGALTGWAVSSAPTGPVGWPEDWFADNKAWFQPDASGKNVGVHICTNGIGWGTAVAARLPNSDDILFGFPARLPAPPKTPASGAAAATATPSKPLEAILGKMPRLGTPGKAATEAAAKAPPAETHGFRVLVYRAAEGEMVELPPVLPQGGTVDQAAMQLTFVAPEGGPVLAYWYDMDEASDTGSVRGRIYYDAARSTKDFAVSRDAGSARAFPLARTDGGASLCGAGRTWYGDFRSAGAFKAAPRRMTTTAKVAVRGGDVYRYFPVWVEPDKTVRYAEITAIAKDRRSPAFFPEIDREPLELRWLPPGPPREIVMPEDAPEIGGLKRQSR